MEPIGLIAAMTQESQALLHLVKGAKRLKLGEFHGDSFELSGKSCVLITSGMGLLRARAATRCLVELNNPRLLISFGIAGAVEPDLEIGDVVTPVNVCLLEAGAVGPLQALALWPAVCSVSMTRILAGRGAHFYSGSAVTTRGAQLLPDRPAEMFHPVLEMETAGIAEEAQIRNLPLLSIRAISDGPRAPIPINMEEVMDKDAHLQVGKLFKAVIRHPSLVLKSNQMLRNNQKAADNAAAALVAALEGLDLQPAGEV